MHDITSFLNRLRLSSGAIWLEQDALKLSTPPSLQTPETKELLARNKEKLIELLKRNNIRSKQEFLDKKILAGTAPAESPLSSGQERLWFIEQFEGGTDAYHVPMVYELEAHADEDALKYALSEIVQRHEVLRSTIAYREETGHHIQSTQEDRLSFETISLAVEKDYRKVLEEDMHRPFHLDAEWPIKVKFYHIKDKETTHRRFIMILLHHIAFDGWSEKIFENELNVYYEAYLRKDLSFKLPLPPIQYKDYAAWQRTFLGGEILEKQSAYWKDKLSGFQTLEFPTDRPRPGKLSYKGASVDFHLNPETSEKIRELARVHETTVHTVLLSSISILLSKYTGQSDVVSGSINANRHNRLTEGLIGFFVNTQVNRVLLSSQQSFSELIRQVHEDLIEAQPYLDLPFEKLVDELNIEPDSSRHPIFQVLFAMDSFNRNNDDAARQVFLKPYPIDDLYPIEKFDLSVYIDDSGNKMSGQISYSTALFERASIERLTVHYTHLADQLAKMPNVAHSTLSLLDDREYEQIVHHWSGSGKDFLQDQTLHVLFEAQVQKTPDAIALIFEEESMTYKTLNEKSNRLARQIRQHYLHNTKEELQAGTFIALCLDRSLEMTVAILAVLKAGAAYVPIDPDYPQDRIDYILKDTQANLLLTQKGIGAKHAITLPQELIFETDLDQAFYAGGDCGNLPRHSQPHHTAYVIYTSGTTGKPKGVVQPHCNVIRLFTCSEEQFGFDHTDTWTFYHSYAFDFSVWELWGALIYGGKLLMISKQQARDIEQFYALCKTRNVTVLNQTPSAFYRFVDAASLAGESLLSIRYIILGGEALDNSQLKTWWGYQGKHLPAARLINMYGITETTVHVTYREITRQEAVQSNIGKALADLKTYILDAGKLPVPVGVVGELYIGGAGLATGYLNRPELSSEKFVPNPFASESDMAKGYTRLYRSGDLARWLPDGNIEYIGRNDDQVKIRGFRIELGEIENALARIEGIRRACVLVKTLQSDAGASKYLAAYYEAEQNASFPGNQQLLDELAKTLPEYMVPATLIRVDTFQMTANGKLNKNALPEPDFQAESGSLRPETELEISISHIYAAVLGIAAEKISVTQNFFRMGGNSILTIQLKQKLNQLEAFKQISIADLFRYNSIQKLVKSIQKEQEGSYKLQQQNHATSHEIAIIGMSGAFSGADNLNEFWQLIRDQKEGIRFHETTHTDTHYVPVEGSVKDIEWFDPAFWEISPNEARLLDPQIRKFMEHAWMALESAGYAKQRKQHHIGVFAGSGLNSYLNDHILNGELAEQIDSWEAMVSNNKDALATKTAYFLGLSGPANSINTACSTSLVAVVEACKNLQLGVCDMALAGGVSLALPDQVGYVYQEGMILSRDGHCRTFDKHASGTSPGSGAGVVLLKRLDEAIRDQDPILAVIKGYATNNDGDRKSGYTAPSVIGQSECIINAQRMAGIKAEQVDYVECHGTATLLGDPIEVKALHEAFQFNRSHSNYKTVLGAVKANIGHADSAAGIASLIKVCRMIEQQILPGQVNFSEPNPELQLEHSNFEILKENRVWAVTQNKQRLAGVSSFGVGGTNAHVIIGEYNNASGSGPNEQTEKTTAAKFTIPLSAKNRKSLELYRRALLSYLSPGGAAAKLQQVSDIAYTLQEKRETFKYREAYTVSSIQELVNQLKANTAPFLEAEEHNKVVFMFPGQGSQYRHMAQNLYEQEPGFKEIVNQCIALANPFIDGTDLHTLLFDKQASQNLQDTQWAQIALFIVEYSLAKYLELNGLKADAYIGHSIGEFVAATLAGVFNLKDAIKLVIERGRLMQDMEKGSMLAIQGSEQELIQLISEHQCEIAVINSPSDIVVSGEHEAILNLQESLKHRSIASVFLHTSHAYHSEMMEPAAAKFISAFEGTILNSPSKPFISNLSGEIAGGEVTSPEYWKRQLRHTVQFGKGLQTLGNLFNQQLSFIEAGPGKSLCAFVSSYKNKNRYSSIQSLQLLPSAKEVDNHTGIPTKEELRSLLWSAGLLQKPNDASSLKGAAFLTDLPVYQFDFQKCWLERKSKTHEPHELSLLPKEQWLSAPVWAAVADTKKQVNSSERLGKTLVFIRDQQATESFAASEEIIRVILDSKLGHEEPVGIDSQSTFRINPTGETHFKMLAVHLKTKGFFAQTLIHACSLDAVNAGIETTLESGFYSLFLIRQFILGTKGLERLIVLSRGLAQITGEDPIVPLNGAMVGAIRNINHEFPALDARIIDAGPGTINHVELMAAMRHPDYHKCDALLAIRFGKIWKERYEEIKLSAQHQAVIRDGDVILVTGGLGGVALAIAQHIAQHHKVTFVVVGRKELPKTNEGHSKLQLLNRISELGSTVDIRYTDLADSAQVSNLNAYLKSNYGPLQGLIHTAGVFPLETGDYRIHRIKEALGGKVYGIDHLLSAIEKTQLRFVAMTSSLASIMGDINRIEYCAANSFLDYLVADKTYFGEALALSINWPGWLDTGMAAQTAEPHEAGPSDRTELQKLLALNSVSAEEGAGLFYRLLDPSTPQQVVLSKLDMQSLQSKLFDTTSNTDSGMQIDILEKNFSDAEYSIASIFASILGIKQLSVYDDFFKIGGNSIMAIQASHKISLALNAEFKVADMFRLKSCRQIAEGVVILETDSENVQMEF